MLLHYSYEYYWFSSKYPLFIYLFLYTNYVYIVGKEKHDNSVELVTSIFI